MTELFTDGLFNLTNNTDLWIHTLADDPNYEYECLFFDADTQEQIDGTTFNSDAETNDELVKDALIALGANSKIKINEVLQENVDYDDMIDLGYEGWGLD